MRALILPESEIVRQGPAGSLGTICWAQWRTERALGRRGVRFRSTDEAELERAYSAMSPEEFAAINGRQAWANWRTIPRCLSGHVPDRGLLVVDLGCGAGDSSAVLAFWCPAGSRVIGYELSAPLAAVASRRRYRHRTGATVDTAIIVQGVGGELRDADGRPLAAGSVDLVHSSGLVGHHLTRSTVGPLVQELARVVSRGGHAFLDVGPTLGDGELTACMREAGFQRLCRKRSFRFDPTGEVVFVHGAAEAPGAPERVQLVYGDLLSQPVEGIVNAWNRNVLPWWLLLPQGVSGAIKRAAGTAPFRELVAKGAIPLGGAVHTGAGRLPFRALIHVAAIDLTWRASAQSIADSVTSAMRLAERLGLSSVALPVLGSGSGGYPADEALGLILDTLERLDSPVRAVVVRHLPGGPA